METKCLFWGVLFGAFPYFCLGGEAAGEGEALHFPERLCIMRVAVRKNNAFHRRIGEIPWKN